MVNDPSSDDTAAELNRPSGPGGADVSDQATGEASRRRYMIRFFIGVALLIALAVPAKIHSDAAIQTLHNRPAEWVPDTVPVKADYNRFAKQFDVRDLLLIAWPGSDLDSEPLADAAAMLEGLASPQYDEASAAGRRQRIESVASRHPWIDDFYRQARQMVGEEFPLRWVRSGTETIRAMTSPPASMSDAAAVRRLRGTLVGPDGRQTCVVAAMEISGDQYRRQLIPMIRENLSRLLEVDAADIAIVGGPYDGAVIDSAAIATVAKFSPLSAVIAALLCLICLRSLPLTAVIVATAVIGQGLVLAFVYYAGYEMNAILIVLPPLVFVLTVSSGIHLSNYYLDIIREFPERSSTVAAAAAMRAGVLPCLLAAATTVVGLSSLLLVRLQPVRVFGAVASIGVMMTLAILILILPGAMLLTRRRRRSQPVKPADAPEPGGVDAGGRVNFHGLIRRRLARPWPTIIGFAITAVVMAWGLRHLDSSVNVPRMFTAESQLRRSYDWFETNVGATATGDVVLTFPPARSVDAERPPDSLDRFAKLVQVQRAINAVDGVGGTLSAATFVPGIPSGRSFAATRRRGALRGLLDDPDSSIGRLNYITRDDQGDHWRITVRMPQSDQANFRPRINAVLAAANAAAADFDPPPTIRLTGHVVIVEESQSILLSDLFTSFLTAFGIIAVVMMLMLRSVVGGLLAMLPNLFPTLLLFGLMGWIRLPLDIGSVMSASVALGIAVDDTVHLLSRFGSRRARGIGQIRAAHGALSQCGWAMFQTTVVCGLALMAYYFSDFVPTSRFALFMFALLVSALVGVLFLLPSMMASPLGRFLSRTVGADPSAAIYGDAAATPPPPDVRRV